MYTVMDTITRGNLGTFPTYEKARQKARKRLRSFTIGRSNRQPLFSLKLMGLKIVKKAF